MRSLALRTGLATGVPFRKWNRIFPRLTGNEAGRGEQIVTQLVIAGKMNVHLYKICDVETICLLEHVSNYSGGDLSETQSLLIIRSFTTVC
jgi:hypothetical protein